MGFSKNSVQLLQGYTLTAETAIQMRRLAQAGLMVTFSSPDVDGISGEFRQRKLVAHRIAAQNSAAARNARSDSFLERPFVGVRTSHPASDSYPSDPGSSTVGSRKPLAIGDEW